MLQKDAQAKHALQTVIPLLEPLFCKSEEPDLY